MNRISKLFLMSLVSADLLFAQAGKKTDQAKNDLARVSILEFFNGTGSADFKYLAGSISDAIDTSMQQKFEYERKNTVLTEIYLKTSLTQQNIQEIAQLNQLDIVIFGSYDADESKTEVIIKTGIYLAYAKKFLQLPDIRNKVDSTIFQATEKTASLIVAEIRAVALASQTTATAIVPDKTTLLLTGENPSEELLKNINDLKTFLATKFDGNFLTLAEYTKQTSLKPGANNKLELNRWLGEQKFRSGLFVEENKGQITIEIVVNGKTTEKRSYTATANETEKEKIFADIAQKTSLPPKETAKVSLKTESLTKAEVLKPVNWEKTQWLAGLSVAGPKALLRFDELGFFNNGPEMQLNFSYFWHPHLFSSFYITAVSYANFISADDGYNQDIKLSLFSALASIGWRFSWAKWLFMPEIALGYYQGRYENLISGNGVSGVSANNFPQGVNNPVVYLRVGIQYMIWQFFSVGAFTAFTNYFDKDSEGNLNSLNSLVIGIQLNYAY